MTTSDTPPNSPYPRGSRIDSLAWPVADLVDDALAAYLDWRREACAVADAYHRCVNAPPAEQAGRFAAHTAALDQEQASATAYAHSIATLERWLSSTNPPSRVMAPRDPTSATARGATE
ncbi:MAG: hypothetical protein ACRDNS_05390 [Trebonia sp.]